MKQEQNFGVQKRFIPDDRTVELLSDAVNLMSENTKKETKFVELLVGINEINVESVFRQIDEDNVKKACKIINISVEIRPLEIENFLTLVSLISSKFSVCNLPDFSDYFRSLLIARGILPNPNNEINYNESITEFTTGSIERTIREDNVEQFCKLISDQSFNAKNKVNISSMNKCESYMKLLKKFGLDLT